MIDDAVLSIETALMYQNAFGFEPVAGNLTHWRGVVKDRMGSSVLLDINLPPDFPNSPPNFALPSGTTHPAAGPDGKIAPRSLTRWRNSSHIYQVLRDVRQAVASGNFSNAVVVHASSHDDALTRQLSVLKNQLKQKEAELEEIQKMPVSTKSNISAKEVAEESLLHIDSDLYALEDSFDRLEIDDVEFMKKFYHLRKRYYMIETSI